MKKKVKQFRTNLAFNTISLIVSLLIMYSVIVSISGLWSFTKTIENEYSTTTYHMADTAATLVNGDHIDRYLEEGAGVAETQDEEFKLSEQRLDGFCKRMSVSLVYVIKVDTSDYNSFKSVFNLVNNSVGNTSYTPWELGYERATSGDEYKEKYRSLYHKESDYETIFRTTDLKGIQPHITTLVPVKNSSDEVTALLCIQRPMSEYDSARRPYLIQILIATVVAALFVAIVAGVRIKRKFVNPMRRISAEATRFAKENTRGEKLADLSDIVEISELGASVDRMEKDMLQYIDHLTAATAERERINAELSISSTIQENALPNTFPAFPDRTDFDIYASMTPAKKIGGDFYNFFLIDDDHLAFAIGDVSGKGIPAALFMMVVNILLSDRTYMGGTPAEILAYINDAICQRNKADMFVTLWLGILEISTGKLTAANAGHDDAAVCHKGGEFELFSSRHGLVIGAMEGVLYHDFEIQLHPGDKLFLYTDGVPEATDAEKRMFTLKKMVESLNLYKDESPRGILEGIHNDVNAFVGDAPQFDDLTMLCLELTEQDKPATLTVDAKVDNLDRVMAFVTDRLEGSCSAKAKMQIDLALEEIFVNIANYAYDESGGTAEIVVDKADGKVAITLKDSGTPYNPLEKPDPDTTLSAEDRKIGGLGVYLVKQYMDDVTYVYENGQNNLTITKKFK